MNCGRVRIPVDLGITPVVFNQLERLRLSVIKAGDVRVSADVETAGREYAFHLVQGEATLTGAEGEIHLGPRIDPFAEKPWCVLYSGGEQLEIAAEPGSLVAVASAQSSRTFATQVIKPQDVREAVRGKDNWTRRVRLVCWADNTEGEQLLVGETITPSGNWSTIPPHRHAQYREGAEGPLEVPYEEVYFYQFSRPTGFGLCWQFDPESGLDQAFSLKADDAVYLGGGYHPITCGPGSTLYQLTLMAGPHRQSTAAVHPDYEYLLNETENPFRNQEEQV